MNVAIGCVCMHALIRPGEKVEVSLSFLFKSFNCFFTSSSSNNLPSDILFSISKCA